MGYIQRMFYLLIYTELADINCYRRDWGALILIDERFAKYPQKYTSGLLFAENSHLGLFQSLYFF